MPAMVHILLHFVVPLIVARLAFAKHWRRAFGIMMVTMLVDLDHLRAYPIYDPDRCSIGFHPLHSSVPILVYCLFVLTPKLRTLGVGLVLHMVLDGFDCLLN